MSRGRFAAYFVALSACSTAAFASYLFEGTPTPESAELAAFLEAPMPHRVLSPKPALLHAAPKAAQVAFVN